MTTLIDYALMAGASYISNRAEINRIPAPDVWLENIQMRTTKDSGFEATYFVGINNEIVISFAGTNDKDYTGDIAADLALAAGTLSDQLKQAADYYLLVKASAPAGATISFTGHSLGGGLASLMAVMFGESATTFDQAPFLNSALTYTTTDTNGNTIPRSVAQDLRTYLTGRATDDMLVKLDAYIAASNPLNPTPIAADTLAARSGLVTNINTQGEFLSSWFLVPSSNRIGSQTDLANIDNISGLDLHSQALLTAMLQSGDTKDSTAADHTLGQVTFKLTDLLKMIFDGNLFAHPTDPNSPDVNLLEHLVRHEAGVQGSFAADAMVTRFTSDLWKLAQDGGLTMSDWPQLNGSAVPRNVSQALIAFAMQKYYEEQAGRAGEGKTLFQNISGGVQFDTEAVVGAGNSITSAQGYVQYFEQYLNQVAPGGTQFTAGDRQIIQAMLPVLYDWYVQAGANGMVATDTQNRGAFMLGGKDGDALTGGNGNDLLVGNEGNDILQGGKGDDTLLGGAGNDTYIINSGDGNDTIEDKQGNNTVIFNGRSVAMLFRQSDGSSKTADGVITGAMVGTDLILTDTVNGGTLTLNQNFAEGDFGIKFMDAPATPGNVITFINIAELGGTEAADHLIGNTAASARDYYGGGGDDLIEGYNDATAAQTGVLDGGAGNDYLFSNAMIGTAEAIANGNTDVGGSGTPNRSMWGLDANWLNGGAGDDVVVAGAQSDVLFGGKGRDLLISGAGDDYLFGDIAYDRWTEEIDSKPSAYADWLNNIHTTPTGVLGLYLAQDGLHHVSINVPSFEDNPPDGGNDTFYAGNGNDIIWAGSGNDVAYGEAGDDLLIGQSGSDLLFGGDGKDQLMGDDGQIGTLPGDDYLDGGAGDDLLWGAGGNDTLIGGDGNDYLDGDGTGLGNGSSGVGNDYLDGGAGDDKILGGAGDDTLLGGAGNDELYGHEGDDTLSGGAGDDILSDGAGVNTLEGGDGSDTLYGAGGADTLNGGLGNDTIYTQGNATIVYNLGDGTDTIIRMDAGAGSELNYNFANIDPGSFKLGNDATADALVLDFGNGDAIRLQDANTSDVFNSLGGASFTFADGQTLTGRQVLERGFDIDGTNGNDTLLGTNATDRIGGLAGDDALNGGAGDDTLTGGAGNDILTGGAGGDTYVFGHGDGQDIITDQGDLAATDTIQLAQGINRSDVMLVRRSNGDLLLQLNGSEERIVVQGQFSNSTNRIEQIIFGDGSVLTAQQLDALPLDTYVGGTGSDTLGGTNANDTLLGGIGTDTYRFGYNIGADTVVDASVGGNTIQLQGLAFNNLSATQSGNDLLLKIRGTTQGMTLKDYYLTPQDWVVMDGTGAWQTMADILTATANQDEYSALRDDFMTVQEAQLRADNPAHSALGTAVTANHSNVTTLTTTTISWLSRGFGFFNSVPDDTTTSTTVNNNTRYSAGGLSSDGYLSLTEQQTSIQKTTLASDAANITADAGQTIGTSGQYVQAAINWGAPYNVSTNTVRTTRSDWLYDTNNFITGQFGETVLTQTELSSQDGAVVGLYQSGSVVPPQTVLSWLASRSDNFNLQEITGGASDNTIDATNNTYAVVNGGAGNDTLSGGGLLYGGEGNDVLNGGTLQYGGNGDDILSNGQLLNGGAGNDTMDGGAASSRYVIDPTQTGIDLIRDTGDSEQAYKSWYYTAQGIPDWQMRDRWGGYYTSASASSDSGYFKYDDPNNQPPSWVTDPVYIEPLPAMNRPAAFDYAALQAAYDAGVIPADTLEFAAGIALSDLQLTWGETTQVSPVSGMDELYRTLNLSWNGGASQIQLVIPHFDDPLGSGVEQIKFADGSVVAMQTLIAMAPSGIALDPRYPGIDLTLIGTAGADTLVGQWGNDALIGLGGNDELSGRLGADTYVFNPGDGQDTVTDDAGQGNSIRFGAGIAVQDVNFQMQGNDVLVSYSDTDSILIKNFDLYGLNGTAAPIEAYQFADGSSITVNAGDNYDGAGSYGIDKYDVEGTLVGSQWGYLNGNHGSDYFNADGSSSGVSFHADGSRSEYTDDGQGNSGWMEFDAGGFKTGDTLHHADGTWLQNAYNADGSSSGTASYPSGCHSAYTDDGQGNVDTTHYGIGARVFSNSWVRADGTSGSDTFNLDGSHNSAANNGTDTITTTNFGPGGNQIGYSITHYDASGNTITTNYSNGGAVLGHSTSTRNASGAVSTTNYDASGNSLGYSVVTNDASGNTATTTYNPSGVKVGDGWTKADGTSGGTNYNPDGTFSRISNRANGELLTQNYGLQTITQPSPPPMPGMPPGMIIPPPPPITVSYLMNYNILINDGHGSNTTTNYTAGGAVLGSFSSGYDAWGGVITSNFDAAGTKLNDTWSKADGSYGNDVFHADGSSAGSAYQADGSYSDYVDDGLGNNTRTSYDASETKASVSWTKADGSNGIETFNPDGSSSGAHINGSAFGDIIVGTAANDVLNGGAGNDTLTGGTGDDTLMGGAGDDTYIINAGDGVDTIIDNFTGSENNTIVFGAGVDPANIKLFQGSLGIDLGNGTVIHIQGVDYSDIVNTSAIRSFRFADGTVLTTEQLVARGFDTTGSGGNDTLSGTNVADRIVAGAGDDTLSGGKGNDVLDGGTGNDSYLFNAGDGADTIVDSSRNGAETNTLVLGAGITADMITAAVSATGEVTLDLGNGDSVRINRIGDLSVQHIQFADGSIVATASLLNTAPVSALPIAAQSTHENAVFSFAVPAGTFTDSDQGDVLTYSATMANPSTGSGQVALPGWLVFDAATQTFSGTPGNNDAGSLDVVITATDKGGLSASAQFNLNIANTINGTVYNDTLNGTVGADYIQGLAGNDTINAGDGNDTLIGGAGSDVLSGGLGDDTFLIEGVDTAYDRFQGDAGFDVIQGGASDDTIRVNYFSGAATVEKIDGGAGLNVIAGSQYNDTIDLSGTELLNIANIDGGVGNDVITGSAGNDTIIGGAGSDVLAGGAGDDTFLIDGTDTSYDRFQGDAGFDVIQGGAADDTIRVNYFSGASTVEKIDGGAGLNVIAGSQYNDTIDLSGTELLNIANIDGGIGNDVITGSAGNDIIIGGAGSDVLAGGAGDDTFQINGIDTAYDRFQGDAGFDVIQGGAGDDVIRVNYFSGAATVEKIDGGAGLNVIAGSQYNDTIDLSGTELANIANIDGGVGNDVITGSSGNDTIIGGAGSDVLAGGAGDDTFQINGIDTAYDRFQGDAGFDVIQGSAGDDTIRVNYFSGAATVEKIDGGLGINVIAGSQYNDTIDLSGTELANIANIDGGIGNDVITGSAGNDTIIGGTGSDVLAGGAGNDVFQIDGADTAYDRFQGDAGFDVIQGGAGDDVIRVNYFSGASTVEKIDGGAGLNVIAGSQYNDTIDLSATELVNIGKVDGGAGNDVVTGSAGNDILQGGLGSDRLTDASGNNLLDGGEGADVLVGGAGNEMFVGGTGNDTLTTGSGADIIAFNRGDGADIVNGGIGTDNTITLGKGIAYSDIALSKVNNDLILEVGGGEQITLSNWYNTTDNYKSVLDLQMMADAMAAFDPASSDPLLNRSVQNFDFSAVANAFDQARGTSSTFMHWSATNSLLAAHLSGSDTVALGGDLAHQYGTNGSLAGMSLTAAQTALNDPQFGGAQTLRPLQGLQGGAVTL